MVPSRKHLVDKAEEALDSYFSEAALDSFATPGMAEHVVNALLPEITDPKQLLGVPEGSYLVSTAEQVFELYQGGLALPHSNPRHVLHEENVKAVLPLTVVWMP